MKSKADFSADEYYGIRYYSDSEEHYGVDIEEPLFKGNIYEAYLKVDSFLKSVPKPYEYLKRNYDFVLTCLYEEVDYDEEAFMKEMLDILSDSDTIWLKKHTLYT